MIKSPLSPTSPPPSKLSAEQISRIRKLILKQYRDMGSYIDIAMTEAIADVTITTGMDSPFFEAMVVTAVKNKLIDEHRRKKKLNRLPEDTDSEPALQEPSKEDRILDDIAFAEHLALVTPKQAEVLRMDFEEGMTNKQISKKIGITVNSVKERKKLAFAVIREYILKTDTPKKS